MKENVIVCLFSFGRFVSNLEVVSELVFCGSFRFWGERVFLMTGGISQVCQNLIGGDSYVGV